MTDERLDRIEHVTAGLVEKARKDREEDRQLWRDTQRQLNELAIKVGDLTIKISDTNERLEARITQLAEEARAADRALAERISSLVSGMGAFMGKPEGK